MYALQYAHKIIRNYPLLSHVLFSSSPFKASGCIIGKDYPAPIVDHAVASRACMAKMQAAYAAAAAAAGGDIAGEGEEDGEEGEGKKVSGEGKQRKKGAAGSGGEKDKQLKRTAQPGSREPAEKKKKEKEKEKTKQGGREAARMEAFVQKAKADGKP